jgi:CAAX protease family protein
MDSSEAQPGKVQPYRLIASPIHLLLVLLLEGAIAYRGLIHIPHSRSVPDHVGSYLRTISQEWLVLAFVLAGVWLGGTSLLTVLGQRWRSPRQFLYDLGIGVAFLIVPFLVVAIVGQLLGMKQDNRDIQFLLPHGRLETALWVFIAVSAGICEEAVFRGYLQLQFIALTRSAPLGILLSAMSFGLVHSYQGFPRAAVIAIGGVLSGALAFWRKSVRPGMFAHTLQDLLALLVRQ